MNIIFSNVCVCVCFMITLNWFENNVLFIEYIEIFNGNDLSKFRRMLNITLDTHSLCPPHYLTLSER